MFYSHQLLARKAPMGQIWMAATMHAKMSKRKLSKINIIQICDEILNPKVPMALRLSSILMGGVVIVYERKVKLLYDDVNRLLVELNEAWKVKLGGDPNILPKQKRQAKREAVTLPNQQDTDFGEMERFMDSSTSKPFAAMNFQPSAYITMNLDTVDEFTENIREEDLAHQHHQADLADITLEDQFDPYQAETVGYTSFERFDVEGDEDIQMQFPPHEHEAVNLNAAPGPSSREETSCGFGMYGTQPEVELNHPHNEARDDRRDPLQEELQKKNISKKKARTPASSILIDDEHVVIPSTVYQSWLQNTSDIVSREKRNKKRAKFDSSLKMKYPSDLPNVVLLPDLLGNRISDHYFPVQLKELWRMSVKSSLNSPSGRNTAQNARAAPSPHRNRQQDPHNFFDGSHSGFTPGSNASVEEQRAIPAVDGNFMPAEDIIGTGSAHNITPNQLVNELTAVLSQGSMGSMHRSFTNNSDGNTISGKKRPLSSSHNNSSGLKTVVENHPLDAVMEHEPNFFINEEPLEPNFNLAEGLAPQNAYANLTPLLEETGRTQTQTQRPVVDEEMENTTSTIRMHLKTYFEGPEAPQSESLDQLTDGLNRKQAAQLFFQTCVLATREVVKVKQTIAYGDIMISRGAKM